MKTVFISYLRSEVNKEKLDRLIKLLEESDIRVIIDERNLEIGGDLPLFMEKNLVESDFIIVILTSGYKKRADDREGGVGYEAAIMAASLSKRETIKKFLPVTFETYRDEIVPVFLASKLASDLSDNLDSITFKGAVNKLKRTILGISMD
ncbi:toll/interleukin-1 receptor domain-containing protein [Pediococcus acidilactici]|uniref:toll/interleukin-1 receptor domain-containing protein n=1 Tax=Pediococcus acidilactici TaxID=1254 RepID=UPI002F263FC1